MSIFSRMPWRHRGLSRPTANKNEEKAFSLGPHLGVKRQSLYGVECIVDVLGFAAIDFELLQCAMDESSIAHGLIHVVIVNTINDLDTLFSSFLVQLRTARQIDGFG